MLLKGRTYLSDLLGQCFGECGNEVTQLMYSTACLLSLAQIQASLGVLSETLVDRLRLSVSAVLRGEVGMHVH